MKFKVGDVVVSKGYLGSFEGRNIPEGTTCRLVEFDLANMWTLHPLNDKFSKAQGCYAGSNFRSLTPLETMQYRLKNA